MLRYWTESYTAQTLTIQFSPDESDCVTVAATDCATPSVALVPRTFKDWLLGSPVDATVLWHVDSSRVKTVMQPYYVENKDAEIVLNKSNKLTLISDTSYHEFDYQRLSSAIRRALDNGDDALVLYDTDVSITYPAAVLRSDLVEAYNDATWLNSFEVTYSDGTKLDSDFFSQFYTKDFTVDVESVDLTEILDKLEDSYDTVGDSWTFTDHNGKDHKVTNATFGYHVFRDKETEAILLAIENHESITDRVPETYGVGEIGSEYLEISINDQHVWHIKDGNVHCESAMVSGTANKHDTPRGVFYISEMVPGKYLTGDTYRTWVNRWMRLTNSGVGLHDATWRYNFGGAIYKSSGSHGCVNLPKTFAYSLYDELSVKTPVIVY